MRISSILAVILGNFLFGCGNAAPEDEDNKVSTTKAEVSVDQKTSGDAISSEPTHASQEISKPVPIVTYPAYVTAYDIQTPEDEFYYHHLKFLCEGSNFTDWPLVKSLVGLGQDFIDAPQWASIATEAIYTSNQPRAKPITDMVNECAEILGIDAPEIYIKGDNEPNAYVAGLSAPHHLVLTSGLLDLYEESPEELRFIIGHELGHLKAQHIRTHFVGRMFVQSIIGDEAAKVSFADDFIASLSVHTLLHWYRESEYSADRAGLLCIGGNLKVAKQALLRLTHQTKPSNKLLDPLHPEFDTDLVLEKQMRIRDQPFVKVFYYLRQFRHSHPFIPERCAALQTWSLSAEYQTIMERKSKPYSKNNLTITSLEINNIPLTDTYVPGVDSGETDPFVRITYAGESVTTGYIVDTKEATWDSLSKTDPFQDGANIIIELFDYNSVLSNKLVGACLIPIKSVSPGEHEVVTDLRLDIQKRSTVVELPKVKIKYNLASK
ncbi:M48 family metalloprotease [Gimesia chilikensis]|uniref:M48 family metalloprotease n=1 Tax=Gimesia chilikensis TaxID=2605989 RepID=UPI0011ECED84|nr:M48 family metalloprotease [Gimesia chilikensis]KAA0139152.1 M48 family metalloprotease [Gimesia chilikensis]